MESVIRTAIVEDMRDIREGLATLIKFTEGFVLTGDYRSMEEAIPRVKGNARLPKLLVEGNNYTTAAAELGVSYNTIKFHMRHIYENSRFTPRAKLSPSPSGSYRLAKPQI
jgi:hypothetical protein